MGAAGFDQCYRMRQLCSWECEIAHGPIKYVSGCDSKIPRKHSETYTNMNIRNEGWESSWPGSATESL